MSFCSVFGDVLRELVMSCHHVLGRVVKLDDGHSSQNRESGKLLLAPKLLPRIFAEQLLFEDV